MLINDMQAWLNSTDLALRSRPTVGERVQSLWRGYGELRRVHLPGGETPHAVLKWIAPPQAPTGDGSGVSHARKLRSYAVETAFYRDWAHTLAVSPRVARCLAHASDLANGGLCLLLEDLVASGFTEQAADGDLPALEACVDWLAAFHAQHLGAHPDGLWPVGCYWHFGTRAAEWRAMAAGPLKTHAVDIDHALGAARWKTLVHGDAKTANFCFDPQTTQVAAVDFQYVGGGVGVRDLVTLFASALDEPGLVMHADRLLDRYFARLLAACDVKVDGQSLEREWRALWPVAWADYQRFLAGWRPADARRTQWAQAHIRTALAFIG